MSSLGKGEHFANSHGSGRSLKNLTTAPADSTFTKSGDNSNLFSSSSSSFASAISAKYKSIEKINKDSDNAKPVEHSLRDDSPPPLPPTAAPDIATETNGAARHSAAVSSLSLSGAVQQNKTVEPSAPDSGVGGDSLNVCRFVTAGNDENEEEDGDQEETTLEADGDCNGGDSSRRLRLDQSIPGADGNSGRGEGSRHSRHGSSCNGYRVMNGGGVVAPYIPPPTVPYTTFHHYSPQQLQQPQALYAVNGDVKAKNSPCKIQMFRFLEIAMKRILFHLAKAAVQHKMFFRILPIFLTSLPLIALYFIRGEINFDTPPFESFLPESKWVNGGGGFDANYYYHHQLTTASAMLGGGTFNGSNPMFDAPRRTSPYDFSVILSVKSRFGNILTNNSLNAYRKLFNQIRNISVTHSLIRLEWIDMCREECGEEDRKIISALQNHQLLLKYPEAIVLKTVEAGKHLSNPLNINRIFLANVLGDVELDSDGIIARARSLLLNIKLKESLKSQTLVTFEENLRKILKNFTASDENEDLEVNVWSFRSYIGEVLCSLKDVHFKLIFSFVMFSLFCMATIGFNYCNSYKSRPFVALHVVLVIGFAAILSYSIHILGAGGALNLTLFPSLFILSAIAILMFSATQQCFSRYSMAALHPAEKLAFIYSWDMPCFVGAALTLAISSAGCAWCAENAYIRQSLLILATGLIAILLFGVFYLAIFWYLSEKREASGLKWFQICRKGDESFNNKYVFDYDELICDRLHEKLTDLKPSVSRWFGQLAAYHHFRTICVVCYTAFLIFAGLRFFNVENRGKIELREEFFVNGHSHKLARDDSVSFLHKFDAAYEKYEDYLELVFDLPVDYYNKRNKERIFELLRWPLDNQYATRAVSWLMDFERFQKSTIFDINADTIVPVINYVFLKSDSYRKYSTDIVFDRFQTQILKSRMYLELNAKGLASSDVLIKELERRAKEANLPLVFNAPYSFLLRHDRQVFQTALCAFIWLLALLTVVSVVLFTHPAICLCVPLSAVLVSISVCGSLQFFAVPLNILTLCSVLLGNLFTTSVTIYFCYMFSNASLSQNTNSKRMKYAFQCTLWPTLLACIALVLFYAPLLVNSSPIILHVWKVLVAISVVTFINYLFFLPSVTIILTDYISSCSSSVSKFCDSNGCCVVEQQTESIYFVPGRGNAALPSIHAARSIGSFYNAPNYIMNDAALMLPPAYEYRQHRMIAGVSPQPPPLPIGAPPSASNSAANSAGRHSLGNLGSTNSSAGGNVRHLMAEQLSSSYPYAAYQQSQQSPANLRRQQQRSKSNHSPYHHRYIVQEATDNSNCDSLDSRNAKTSSRRQVVNLNKNPSTNNVPPTASAASSRRHTPSRNRREFMAGENSPRIVTRHVSMPPGKGSEINNNSAPTTSRDLNATIEQIYEEPESPVVLRPRRSQGDGRRRNVTPLVDGSAVAAGQKSSFSPHILRREIADQMSANGNNGGGDERRPAPTSSVGANNSSSVMQPNWRQYLLDGNVSSSGGNANGNITRSQSTGNGGANSKSSTSSPHQAYTVSSPSANRRRYHF